METSDAVEKASRNRLDHRLAERDLVAVAELDWAACLPASTIDKACQDGGEADCTVIHVSDFR